MHYWKFISGIFEWTQIICAIKFSKTKLAMLWCIWKQFQKKSADLNNLWNIKPVHNWVSEVSIPVVYHNINWFLISRLQLKIWSPVVRQNVLVFYLLSIEKFVSLGKLNYAVQILNTSQVHSINKIWSDL